MTNEIYSVPTNQIAISPDMQVRGEVDGERVAQYAAEIEACLLKGDPIEFPPIVLFKVEDDVLGDELWLVDGFHRFYAYQEAGLKEHDCVVAEGSREDAVRYAMVANYAHDKSGALLTKQDRVRAMRTIYELDKDIIKYDTTTLIDRIVELGVSERQARRDTKQLREEMKAAQRKGAIKLLEEGMPQRQVATAVGMSQSAVCLLQKELDDQKRTMSEINHQEEPSDDEVNQYAEERGLTPLFGDEELETEPVENPMEDFNKRLAEREQRKLDREVAPEGYASVTKQESVSISSLINSLSSALDQGSLEANVTQLQSDEELLEQFNTLFNQMNQICQAI